MEHFGSVTGVSHLSDHTIYYPRQDTLSTPGSGYPPGSTTMHSSSPSMSVYAPPAHVLNNSKTNYQRSSGYLDEDVYPSHQRSSLADVSGSDQFDYPGGDSFYGNRSYERASTYPDYWPTVDSASIEFSRPRPTPLVGRPMHFLGPLDLSAGSPRFRPRFVQPGSTSRARTPRGMGFFRPRRMGLTSPGNVGDGAPRRGPAPALYCEVCKVGCAGPKAFAEHQNGQRHKKRVAQNEAIERLKRDEGGEMLKASVNTRVPELRCELCDVCCTGAEAYSAHLSGKLHQRAVRLHRDLGKPVPESDHPLIPTAVAQAVQERSQQDESKDKEAPDSATTKAVADEPALKKVELSKLINEEKKAVGAEFIQTIPGPGGKGVHYQCSLCECQFTNADAKELHIKGRRHRLQYKKKVDPELMVERKPNNQPRRKAPPKMERPLEKTPIIPPMPPSSSLLWPPVLPLNNDMMSFYNMQQSYPRAPFRNQGPAAAAAFAAPPTQHPNVTLENRYLAAKHSSIVPTEMEVQAMKTAVGLCEFSLKRISDALFEASKQETAESVQTEKQDKSDTKQQPEETSAETSTSTPESNTEDARLLRGVVRVGPLGKSLLLRGDYEGQLVLVCSEWPTLELVSFLKEELGKQLNALDNQYEYNLTDVPKQGQINIRITRKVPESELKADVSIADEWPVIIIRIQLTSNAVCEEAGKGGDCNLNSNVVSGAVKAQAAQADGSTNNTNNVTASTALPTAPEQQQQQQQQQQQAQLSSVSKSDSLSRARQLFAHGERIPKNVCLDALDAIDQAKWFQNALMQPSLGVVARVLVDFMRSNKVWLKLNQFGVLALLSRLVSADMHLGPQSSGRPQRSLYMPPGPARAPFGAPLRARMPLPSPPIGPGRLFRRFFEAIASGLLLQIRRDVTDQRPSQSKVDTTTEANVDGSEQSPRFFAYNLLASTPLELREEITVSAQFALRQIAFKQLYKVLHMEPLSSAHVWKKENNRESLEGAADSEVAGSVDLEVSAPGAVKRRRSEVESADIDEEEEVKTDGKEHAVSDEQQQQQEDVTVKSSDQLTSQTVETNGEVKQPEASETATVRSGTAAKRSRRGR